MTDPRFRINVSQTAKGLHQFEVTVEMESSTFKKVSDIDAADIKLQTLGEKLLEVLKDAEQKFREDKRKLVVDSE
jgi:hypothetical protein